MQEELNLRDMMITLWEGKRIIIIFTLMALIVASLYNFMILKPSYETKSLVIANNILVEKDTIKRDITPFAEQILTNSELNKIIEKLKLDKKLFSSDTIKNMIKVVAMKNSNTINISVTGGDPSILAKIANMVAYQLGINIEISDRVDYSVTYQRKLLDVEDKLVSAQSEVDQINKQIAATPEKISTNKTLADDVLLGAVAAGSRNGQNGVLKFSSEELNPAYSELKTLLAASSVKLSSLQGEQTNLKNRLMNHQKTILDLEKRNLDYFNADNISDDAAYGVSAVIISPADEPVNPSGPNRMLNIIITLLVAACISFIVVFLKAQFKKNI